MAIRNIRTDNDPILRKKSRIVENFDEKLWVLLDDMKDTMYQAEGVGLAAVQVGVLKRVVIVDVGDGLIELINPVITAMSGTQCNVEGCLSAPGRYGEVIRPEKVVVNAFDRNGEGFEIMAEGLLAIALCHEIDHLDGNVFLDKVVKFVEVDE